MGIENLKLRWQKLFNQIASDDVIKKGYEDLLEKYFAKGRFYHNLNHIKACLVGVDQVKADITDPFCLEVALWFHDLIYDPKSNDNEALSAAYAGAFLEKTCVKEADILKIKHLINLTCHPAMPKTMDEKLLIDIDLLILGSKTDVYDHYELCIRKEYSFVPYFLYLKKRIAVLKTFLNCHRLYQADFFFEHYEEQARANIRRAIKQLSRK